MKDKNIIVFACDAGMGSSALGAAQFKSRLKKEGIEQTVLYRALDEIPKEAAIVVTHQGLSARAKSLAAGAEVIAIHDFLHDPALDQLVSRLKGNQSILLLENIRLGLESVERDEAIRMAGDLLVAGGYVGPDYVEAMLERERQLSTYLGKGVAIPHGVGAAKGHILKSGLVVLQFPEGVVFGEEKAHLIIGIAGVGNEHLEILSNIAMVLEEDNEIEALFTSRDPQYIYRRFTENQS